MQKKIALLHRHPKDRIKETNAAFSYLASKGVDVLTYKTFDRLNGFQKCVKDLMWIFYAPLLVVFRGYDVIYCDDSFPIYPALVKLVSPKSKVVLRIGDLHLMYYFSGRVYELLHWFEKIAWRMADEIIAISEPMAEFICYESKRDVGFVLDPVDPKYFQCEGAKVEKLVMFHGYLTANKRVDLLIRAAMQLPDVDFVVIGDGPDKKRLMSIAPKNVFFKGWVPFKSIPRHIAACSIGVALRSDNPGNDYVVTSPFLQYGIMGKPCLVTKRKVFGDYLWQFSTVDQMVKMIKYLLNHPEEGEKLKEYVLENHAAEKIAGEIWEILLSL